MNIIHASIIPSICFYNNKYLFFWHDTICPHWNFLLNFEIGTQTHEIQTTLLDSQLTFGSHEKELWQQVSAKVYTQQWILGKYGITFRFVIRAWSNCKNATGEGITVVAEASWTCWEMGDRFGQVLYSGCWGYFGLHSGIRPRSNEGPQKGILWWSCAQGFCSPMLWLISSELLSLPVPEKKLDTCKVETALSTWHSR